MEVRQILDGVKSLEMVIPEFQREYVWPLDDAKQLIISMYKGYPTGCLLFWETNKPPEIKNNAIDKSKLGLTKVILDGQQRLTTLFMLIKGEIPPYYNDEDIINDPRKLYFNVLTEDFQYHSPKLMESNVLWQNITDCFSESKVDAFNIAEQHCELNEELDFKEIAKNINTNLNKLRHIEKMNYAILRVPPNANIDEAIDVFDKVNSKGTKLTDAELVLTHITGHWSHARRTMKDKISALSKIGFHFNLDQLTRCMVIALTDSALVKPKRNSKLKYVNFSKSDYIDNWGKISKAFDYLIPILQQDGLISSTNELNTNNVIIPMIAYLINNNNRFVGNLKYKFLHWMFLALIWRRYSGQTDQRLDKDIHHIINDHDFIDQMINEIKDDRGRIDVKPSDIEGRGAGHALYKMLYIITKANKAIDWSNGGAIYGTIGDNYSIQSHHIFPQAYLYRNGYDGENHLDIKKVNEIANRAFITRDTNYEIKDTAPSKYLPEVESKYPNALLKQFIPNDENLWTAEKYEDFLELRRNTIANEINCFLLDLNNKEASIEEIDEVSNEDIYDKVIEKGENNYTEFKSSLKYCLKEQKPMKYVEFSIIKTISAFLNSEGGTLFVGVDDSGKILGLNNDLNLFSKDNNKDSFLLHFDNMIKNNIGNEHHADIKGKFIKINNLDIFMVKVSSSNKPVFIEKDGKQEFFVRGSASSQRYKMSEAFEYINKHWNQ